MTKRAGLRNMSVMAAAYAWKERNTQPTWFSRMRHALQSLHLGRFGTDWRCQKGEEMRARFQNWP
jgi:hypothetical protein